MKQALTVAEHHAKQELFRQEKTERQEKLRDAQTRLFEAKSRLKEIEAMPVSSDEAKAALLAQLEHSATAGQNQLAAKAREGRLTMSDLMADSVAIRSFVHRYDYETAIHALHKSNGGISATEKQARIGTARQAVQMMEFEVRKYS